MAVPALLTSNELKSHSTLNISEVLLSAELKQSSVVFAIIVVPNFDKISDLLVPKETDIEISLNELTLPLL